MAAKKSQQAPARSDIDAFIESNSRAIALPPEVVADFIYFAEQAEQGKVVSGQGIIRWVEKKYGIHMSRTKLVNEFVKAGLSPWFGK